MDDLLARTRFFTCGELAHLAKDCPQNKELTTSFETFFTGIVFNDSCTSDPRNDFCVDHSRDNSCAGVSRNDSCARDTRNDETFLGVREDDVTFLDVQTDGVPFPVPCSSSKFILGSDVVVGPHVRINVRT